MKPRYRALGLICLATASLTTTSITAAQDGDEELEEEAWDEPGPAEEGWFPEGYEETGDDSVDVETGADGIPDFYAIIDDDDTNEWSDEDYSLLLGSEAGGGGEPEAHPAGEDFQDILPVMGRQANVAPVALPPPPPPSSGVEVEPARMVTRVSLGFKVLENEAKFQAQISYTPDPATWAAGLTGTPLWARKHICGGALIATEWVLTAAHCVNARKLDRGLTVTLGAENIANPRDGQQFRVERIVIHRRASVYQNDIALLKLAPDNRSRNNAEIAPIMLHTGPEPARDTPVSGMGWGQTKEAAPGTQPSAILWRADQKLIPVADCSRLPGFGPNEQGIARINNRVLCAGNSRSKTCSGDSGGPLVMTNGQKLLVGIVAWNKKDCNNPSNPGVYTRVSAFANWIRKGMATTAAGGRVQFLDD